MAAAVSDAEQCTRPTPTDAYLARCTGKPTDLQLSRPLLIVVDLNGTLIHRVAKGGSNKFIPRPGIDAFLAYALAKHKVMIWTSARRDNVNKILSRLLTEEQVRSLVAIWTREDLRLSPRLFNRKIQVYKRLSWVWEDAIVQASCVGNSLVDHDNEHDHHHGHNDNQDAGDGGGHSGASYRWHQGNTVMIDDSLDKAASEPFNLIQMPEFSGHSPHSTPSLFDELVDYIRHLSRTDDVSRYIRRYPFRSDTRRESETEIADERTKDAIDLLTEDMGTLVLSRMANGEKVTDDDRTDGLDGGSRFGVQTPNMPRDIG